MARLAMSLTLRRQHGVARLTRTVIANLLHIAWVSRTRVHANASGCRRHQRPAREIVTRRVRLDLLSDQVARIAGGCRPKNAIMSTKSSIAGWGCAPKKQPRNEPAFEGAHGWSAGHCSSAATTELKKALAWKASRARWSMLRVR